MDGRHEGGILQLIAQFSLKNLLRNPQFFRVKLETMLMPLFKFREQGSNQVYCINKGVVKSI